MSKKVTIENCLKTRFPDVAAEWHPTKNGELIPNDILAGSHNKCWFLCKKGHEWETKLYHRTADKSGCPCCNKVILGNSLQNCFPEVAIEWHPTKNGELTPNDVNSKSGDKFWFLCKKGHEWKATLKNRTSLKNKCPYCAGRKVCNDNCLATKYPEISDEWHPTKNNIDPNDVLAGSNKKYWFQCKNKHEWKAKLSKRTYGKRGCPICLESKGEKATSKILEKLKIRYKRQWKFKSCKDKNSLPFDFVIKTINGIKIIEYQGIQHYEPIRFFGSKKTRFEIIKKHDKIKREWCKEKGVLLLAIPYWNFDKIEEIVKEFVNG